MLERNKTAIGENPPVTVVIIIHGEPPRILETISSIKDQTYQKNQISIICLDDGTSPLAKSNIINLGVKVHNMPKNCNISYAKNFALRKSKDNFLFFLDDHIILDKNSIKEAVKVFKKHPEIAGVCGNYRISNLNDYNILRDIKRETIYGKKDKERFITLDNFTTFSTGIAMVRKDIFSKISFPEKIFPNDFGGEDVPVLITALNKGERFYYTPKVKGIHEHNLSSSDFIKKMETEIRGRFSLLYWASNNPDFRIPYLHGFLNFPYFFILLLLVAIPLSFISYYFLLAPLIPLFYEIFLSLECLTASKNIPLGYKIKSSLFVLLSDFLSIACFAQYIVSNYRRPYKKLGFIRFIRINKIFLNWELEKYKIKNES